MKVTVHLCTLPYPVVWRRDVGGDEEWVLCRLSWTMNSKAFTLLRVNFKMGQGDAWAKSQSFQLL